jgi:hypothetical protein
MERLRYRSTSLADLQAELRERDLVASTRPRRSAPVVRHRRTVFGRALAWRRRRPTNP